MFSKEKNEPQKVFVYFNCKVFTNSMHHNISGFNVCLSALFYARDEVFFLLLFDLIRPLESAPTDVFIESPASTLGVCVAFVLTPFVVSCLSLLLL